MDVQACLHDESLRGGGAVQQRKESPQVVEHRMLEQARYRGKDTPLDRIEFAPVRRVVHNLHRQPDHLGKQGDAVLEFVGAGGVGAAAIAKEVDLFRIGVVFHDFADEFFQRGFYELGRVVRDANVEVALVLRNVVDAIGACLSLLPVQQVVQVLQGNDLEFLEIVVVLCADRLVRQCEELDAASEIAEVFLLFAVHGQKDILIAPLIFPHFGDVVELGVPHSHLHGGFAVLVSVDQLLVLAQDDSIHKEKAPDCAGGYHYVEFHADEVPDALGSRNSIVAHAPCARTV